MLPPLSRLSAFRSPSLRRRRRRLQQAQAQSASGELTKVDVAAKTVTVKADGRDQQFTFNDETKITGAQGAAGLATMEGSQVVVMYTTKDRAQTATEIRVTPKK